MSTASKRSTFLTSNLPPSSANMTQQRRTSDCWLFAALKKHLKVIHITSREEIISRKAWRILHRRVRITCSPLAMWYKTRGTIFRKMRFRNKVHILSYILCLVHFVICLDLEMSVWWDVSPNVLSAVQETCCSAETVGWVFRISHYVTILTIWTNWIITFRNCGETVLKTVCLAGKMNTTLCVTLECKLLILSVLL